MYAIIKVQKGDRNPIPTEYKIFNEVRIMKKLIKKDYFLAAINYLNAMETKVVATVKEQEITTDDLSDFFAKEIALLEKKNASTSKKLTPTQETNLKIKEWILEYMEDEKGYTCSDMMVFPEICDVEPKVSNQRISALVKQMLDETEDLSDESMPLYKKVEKRKSYFYKK